MKRKLGNCDRDRVVYAYNLEHFEPAVFLVRSNVRDVRGLTFDHMRSKLIEHFDIKFRHGCIVWSKRAKHPSQGI